MSLDAEIPKSGRMGQGQKMAYFREDSRTFTRMVLRDSTFRELRPVYEFVRITIERAYTKVIREAVPRSDGSGRAVVPPWVQIAGDGALRPQAVS